MSVHGKQGLRERGALPGALSVSGPRRAPVGLRPPFAPEPHSRRALARWPSRWVLARWPSRKGGVRVCPRPFAAPQTGNEVGWRRGPPAWSRFTQEFRHKKLGGPAESPERAARGHRTEEIGDPGRNPQNRKDDTPITDYGLKIGGGRRPPYRWERQRRERSDGAPAHGPGRALCAHTIRPPAEGPGGSRRPLNENQDLTGFTIGDLFCDR